MTTRRATFGGRSDLRKHVARRRRTPSGGGTEAVTSVRHASAVIVPKGDADVPDHDPAEWDDNGILLFEEFCTFIRTPQRTVRDWKRRGIGPRWWRFNGTGRLYTTVAEVRRFLRPATTTRWRCSTVADLATSITSPSPRPATSCRSPSRPSAAGSPTAPSPPTVAGE